MKKVIALLLALLMVTFVFAACGENKPAETKADETEIAKDSDWDYINNKNKLVVGITYFAPMDYFDEDGTTLIGFDADLARAVGVKLGVNVEFQEINWDTKEAELQSKAIDCIWNGLTVTEERQQQFGFSYNYMENKQALVIRAADKGKYKTADDVKKAKIAVAAEAGSAGADYVTEFMPDNEYIEMEAQSNVFTELKAGTVEAGVVDITMAGSMINAEGSEFSDLMILDLKDAESEFYGIGFRKDSDVVERVNEALMELYNDGTIKEIAEKYGLADVIVDLAAEYGEPEETEAVDTGAAGEITKEVTTAETTKAEETKAETTAA